MTQSPNPPMTTPTTPAPWRATKIGASVLAGNANVAFIPQGEHRQADAALIAASPDLLAALLIIKRCIERDEIAERKNNIGINVLLNYRTIEAIRLAIGKAEGRQP
jgi:hypothetical protein